MARPNQNNVPFVAADVRVGHVAGLAHKVLELGPAHALRQAGDADLVARAGGGAAGPRCAVASAAAVAASAAVASSSAAAAAAPLVGLLGMPKKNQGMTETGRDTGDPDSDNHAEGGPAQGSTGNAGQGRAAAAKQVSIDGGVESLASWSNSYSRSPHATRGRRCFCRRCP